MTATSWTAVEPYRGVEDDEFERWRARAAAVADELAGTAVQRDRANQNPFPEIGLLRQSGLLGFAIPTEFGGAGGSLPQALILGRIVAAADGSIGQLLLYHYSNGVWSFILGTPEQWEFIARGVGESGWFQGSVSNPRDSGFDVAGTDDGGYILNGTRTFATGVAIADYITVGFLDNGTLLNAQIPPDRAGLVFGDDWDNLGQRLTASGSVTFEDVVIRHDEVLRGVSEYPGDQLLREGLRAQFSFLIFAHLYLGIAEGALESAARYIREKGRPWPEATSKVATEDPYVLQLLGKLSAQIAAGVALADDAAVTFSTALRSDSLTAEQWGRLALRVDQAKVVATEAALDATQNIYQATGARSTANSVGLDIYWRNARTHTTHDPLPYRQREVGNFVLNQILPSPLAFNDSAEASSTGNPV
ncbi:acyl-CoA dehydrogenase family protein [Mycolicibacterium komossense]|uniref:Acyl-CoA dehydrogenase family protein n=1 Tax=Mycolicibacterium komossense TaxID=1779 RepID=A0ABT3CF43_9MYCO|nr:acyl-CoA dehydrogenase family protein [Mycolicibacterium komossense]MCV7228105.1 acyl-CoA dehydrogenase family protein [Mycolicibacterium komossense]